MDPALLAVLDSDDPIEVDIAIIACYSKIVMPTPEEDVRARSCALCDIYTEEVPGCEQRPGDIAFLASDCLHPTPWSSCELLA